VLVLRSAQLAEEERQVSRLSVSGEVGGVVEADVEDALHLRVTERAEERLRAPAGQSDREDLHPVERSGTRHDAHPPLNVRRRARHSTG
jgi:hypothetical protein